MNPNAKVYGIDILPELVDLSAANIQKHDGDLLQSRKVTVLQGNGWDGINKNCICSTKHLRIYQQ